MSFPKKNKMANSNIQEEIIVSALRENHLKITKTRVAVYRLLLNSTKPLSHSEITELLKGESSYDRVTIYRTLSEFEEKKIARSLLSSERTTYFEIIEPLKEHAHITCEICGKMECLVDENFHFSIKETGSYLVTSVEILVKGKCGDCK